MKAIVYERYGSPDVLHLDEVETPVPAADEIRIRVVAVSLNGSDREALVGRPLYARMTGLRRPGQPILGSDVAGIVESAGSAQTEFAPGDAVFGELPGYRGGLAEYVCTKGTTLALKPAGLSFEAAAAIPQAGVIALQGIREQGRVAPGQQVLINGAGGSAGTFAVQLAKRLGAEVTAVDHADKLDFLRELGADHVIDYAREDFSRSERRYDLILDVLARRSVADCRRALAPRGSYLCVGGSVSVLLRILLAGPWIRATSNQRVRVLAVPQNRRDLLAVTALCEAGEIEPIIGARFPLADAREGFRLLAEGSVHGKVVVSVTEPEESSKTDGRPGLRAAGGESMWEARAESIPSGLRFRLLAGGRPLRFRDLFGRLETDEDFADWYTALLAEAPLDAFFWEHPPLTQRTLDEPAEFVLVDSSALVGLRPDPEPFETWFARDRGAEVVTFPNLSGDAMLVVPTPLARAEVYPHLADFVRGAPRGQIRALWRAAAIAVRETVGDDPRWLSTSGLGVSWLHLRLDTRPKYYQFTPYKAAPGTSGAHV